MSGRLSTYMSMVRIARQNFSLALNTQKQVNELYEVFKTLEGGEAEYFRSQQLIPVENQLGDYSTIAIVFSALAVEGYIYDYAARNLADNFVKDIDKLSVESKFIVVTKIITGKDFPKGERAFDLLKQLIKNRNRIVHSKSAELLKPNVGGMQVVSQESPEELENLLYTGDAKKLLDFDKSLLDHAEKAISALDHLAMVMEYLDPNELTSVFFHSRVGRAKEEWERTGVWPWISDE